MSPNTAAPATQAFSSAWAKPAHSRQATIAEDQVREPEGSRVLRMRDVIRLTGMGRSSIYAAISCGEFPRQVQLSRRCVGWRARDIAAWLRSRTSVS